MCFVATSSLSITRTISKAAFLPFKASCFELCLVLIAVVNVKPRYAYLLTTSNCLLPRYHFSFLARKPPFLKTIAFVLDVFISTPSCIHVSIKMCGWFCRPCGVLAMSARSSANERINNSTIPGISCTPCLPNSSILSIKYRK